uniref:Calpain catalytic domain-containing protein n=1 Tax=Ditylum brightwellii TaxID=49249 RepID=A0A7S2ECG6_9STRA|mmetsp:Transcript_23682/g.35312  ORF Transcript_23682/g.35312 Transcript_23682/m.35312 type:complete len:511 (+) Transcript_23682:66-1598(+)
MSSSAPLLGNSNSRGGKSMPTIREIHDAKAGTLWNVICCPLVATIGLGYRSFWIYCFPCFKIMLERFVVRIRQYLCCCMKWPYEDDSFIGAKALGDHSAADPSKPTAEEMEGDTEWLRAHELKSFEGKRPQLFEGHIEPSDLCQGAVGDCWLVSGLASASEYSDAIRNVFVTKEYNPYGKYEVKIFNPLKKQFEVVTVDDRIPCQKGTKTPRFMNPTGPELWAMILEKVYAKWAGSYAALDGGFVLWSWHALTGDNVFQMSRNADGTFFREDMVPINDPDDRCAVGFRKTKETYSEQDVWILLKKYYKQKALMSASIAKSDYTKNDGPNGEQLLEREGLVAGHAYSLIQAVEVDDSLELSLGEVKVNTDIAGQIGLKKSNKFHLIQLRNPWGTYEWKGDWSDKSDLWDKHPNIKKKLNFVDVDDGAFWMTYEDFIKVFTRINVCDRTTSGDVALNVREDMGCCGICAGWLTGCAKFWLCCKGCKNLYCGHESTSETLDTKEKGCCGCCGV